MRRMRINLLVQNAPFATSALPNALRFARAALAGGHVIDRVFFYKEAVVIGNRFASDEDGVRAGWVALAAEGGFELAICIAAAARRGIVADTLADGFAIVGLGQLIEAMETGDRLVGF